jgi:hypothetical protein
MTRSKLTQKIDFEEVLNRSIQKQLSKITKEYVERQLHWRVTEKLREIIGKEIERRAKDLEVDPEGLFKSFDRVVADIIRANIDWRINEFLSKFVDEKLESSPIKERVEKLVRDKLDRYLESLEAKTK